jgi:hypothetical protein
MNARQSLSTWGVHAKRCSGVPCEKEEAGEIVADSKASDTHNRAKGIGRSIQLFWRSMFIIGLASIIEADTRHRRHADRNTLSPEFALVVKRQPLELSIPPQSFCFPSVGYARLPSSVCFVINVGWVRTNHQVITPLSKRREQNQR